MVKSTVQRKKKANATKVKKTTKAKQIIKQKVVVNVAQPARRRGRPPGKASEKRAPVQAGETILKTSMDPQYQFYNQLRASVPYVEEIRDEVKRLQADRESNEKNLLGMHQQALLMHMQQQANDYEPPRIAYEEVDDDVPEEVYQAEREKAEKAAQKLEAQRLRAEEAAQKLANKQAGAAKARQIRKERSLMEAEDINSRKYEAAIKEQEKAAIEAERQRIKDEKAAARAAKKAAKEDEARQKVLEEQAKAAAAKSPAKSPAKTPRKRGGK